MKRPGISGLSSPPKDHAILQTKKIGRQESPLLQKFRLFMEWVFLAMFRIEWDSDEPYPSWNDVVGNKELSRNFKRVIHACCMFNGFNKEACHIYILYIYIYIYISI
jgi:hypothetical protein